MAATFTIVINQPDCIVAKVWDPACHKGLAADFAAVEIRVQKQYGSKEFGEPEINHSSSRYSADGAVAMAVCLSMAAAYAPILTELAAAGICC